MGRLAPLSEEPINEEEEEKLSKRSHSLASWIKSHLPPIVFHKKPDFKILLSVLGCPLSPLPLPSPQPRGVASTAQYIMEQFRATTGCGKMEGMVKSLYARGEVRVAMADHQEPGGRSLAAAASGGEKGCFVLWQIFPSMWLMDLSISGHRILAGSNGDVAWRRTPWHRAHAALGDSRPLRRALQGLDPVTIAAVFSSAQHVGEKFVGEEECFVLKQDVDFSLLSARSDNTAQAIKHQMVGFFSQRSGLLLRLEDTQLIRLESPGAQALYWQTNIVSSIEDYRPLDGFMIAHSGRSTATMEQFGASVTPKPIITGMEEAWTIEDVAFNVVGLTRDCFIIPEEVQKPLHI